MEGVKQDMPPPGGFTRVVFERVPLKKYWPAPVKWFLLVACMGVGWSGFYMDRKRIAHKMIEKRSALFSILPALVAEHDRKRLIVYRKARDQEAELMKGVEGWEVGTYKGEPIYKSLEPNEWYEPNPTEPWVYSEPKDIRFPLNLIKLQ